MQEEKRILIVDDSKESQKFLSAILEDHGYRYEMANNGKEAMEAVKAAHPDLILLDIMMPGKSGIFVFKDLKKDPSLVNIPVIFITGTSEATGVDVKTGEQAPVESYSDQYPRGIGTQIHRKLAGLEPEGLVEKPVDPEVLITKIKALLS
jgi:CheY-like chemotaxis protein